MHLHYFTIFTHIITIAKGDIKCTYIILFFLHIIIITLHDFILIYNIV